MTYLHASDVKLRLAAILVCQLTWKSGSDPAVVAACSDIAVSAAEAPFRVAAASLLGVLLESTRNLDASQFLADLIVSSTSSTDMRTNAYWALRQIQFGLADTDFDNFLRGTIHQLKRCADPAQISEEVKARLVPMPGFPEGFWGSADLIDMDFVRKFAGNSGGREGTHEAGDT